MPSSTRSYDCLCASICVCMVLWSYNTAWLTHCYVYSFCSTSYRIIINVLRNWNKADNLKRTCMKTSFLWPIQCVKSIVCFIVVTLANDLFFRRRYNIWFPYSTVRALFWTDYISYVYCGQVRIHFTILGTCNRLKWCWIFRFTVRSLYKVLVHILWYNVYNKYTLNSQFTTKTI